MIMLSLHLSFLSAVTAPLLWDINKGYMHAYMKECDRVGVSAALLVLICK